MGKTLIFMFAVFGAGLVTAQANARDGQTESSPQPLDPGASKSYTGQIVAAGFAAIGIIAGVHIGSCAGSQYYESCAVDGAIIGAIVGMGAATTIDAALLAR